MLLRNDLQSPVLPPSPRGTGHGVGVGVQLDVDHGGVVSVGVDGSGAHGGHASGVDVAVWEDGPEIEA